MKGEAESALKVVDTALKGCMGRSLPGLERPDVKGLLEQIAELLRKALELVKE